MTVAHPATHGSIAGDRPYPIFLVRPKDSINWTCLISNIFITLSFTDLIISVFPLLGWIFSNDATISLSSTSVQIVSKREKCLTRRFILHTIQICTVAIIFSPLSHQHSCQDITEPVTVFGQYGLGEHFYFKKTMHFLSYFYM